MERRVVRSQGAGESVPCTGREQSLQSWKQAHYEGGEAGVAGGLTTLSAGITALSSHDWEALPALF